MRQPIARSLVAALLAVSCAAAVHAGEKDKRLDIYWVDVEGGAATLIVTPAGESILIDSGNPGRRDPDRIVSVAARQAGLRSIDHLITTHYHRDHYGGAETLSKLIPIGAVYDNGVFEGMPDDPGKAYFNFKAGKRVVVQPGMQLKLKAAEGAAKLSLRCLGTRKQFIKSADAADNKAILAKHKPKDRDGSDNANSVVMLLDFGAFRFYDGGDLTWNQELKLVYPKNLIGAVDVYQVTHHGLSSSNNPVVLQTVLPTVAIMNNGVTKGCAPEVFANLKGTKSIKAIYQMHKNLRPDGSTNNAPDEHIANLKKDCDGHFIHLSVEPNGRSYRVEVPSRGHEKTYVTKAK